jgi:hypothetical protein
MVIPSQPYTFILYKKTMKTQRGNIDPGTIIGGLVLILIVGVVISVSVNMNYKIGTSIQNTLSSSTSAEYLTIGNSTSSVNSSLSLAANLPILIVAVLMILILLSVAATLI